MIELNDDKTLFSFDRDLEPVLTVKSGETVRIRTKDCFSNQLTGTPSTRRPARCSSRARRLAAR